MTELEQRFRDAIEAGDFRQPNLTAISERGEVRARKKQAITGVASVAVLTVGALSLAPMIQQTTNVVETADGSVSVEIDVGDVGEDLVSFDDPEGTIARAVAASEDTNHDLDTVDQPILDALANAAALCFAYDDQSGTGTLVLTASSGSADQGTVRVLESRTQGSPSGPEAFDFDGRAVADGLAIKAVGRYAPDVGSEVANVTRTYLYSLDPISLAVEEFTYEAAACDAVDASGADRAIDK